MRRGRRNGFAGRRGRRPSARRRTARRSGPVRNMGPRRTARRRSARRTQYTMGSGSPSGANYSYNSKGLPMRPGDSSVHNFNSSNKTSELFKHPARHSARAWSNLMSSIRVKMGKNNSRYTVFNHHATNDRKLKKGTAGQHGGSVSLMNVQNTAGDGGVNEE